jgi:Tetratricopeptide repeat
MTRARIGLAIMFCSSGLAWADDGDAFREACPLDGLKGGKLVVSQDAIALHDGKKKIAAITHEDLAAFNAAKANVVCKGKRIELDWQLPYSSAYFSYVLELKQGKLTIVEHDKGDPSADTLASAEKLLAEGKIEAAIDELEGMEYPSHYIGSDFVVGVVKQAWTEATARYKRKQAAAAAQLLERALLFHETMGGDEAPALVLYRNDLGFFLAESGKLAEAERVLRAVVAAAPERKVAHLNLADVLWSLGKQAEAEKEYQAYAALSDKWPPQVAKRCPSCKPRATGK